MADSSIGGFVIGVSPIEGSLPPAPVIAVARPDPNYDVVAAIDVLMPGVLLQRNLLDAAWNAYQAKGFLPLTAADVAGILTAANTLDLNTLPATSFPTAEAPYASLPAMPAGLVRLSDSNPSTDGWGADLSVSP